ncbi:MAG: hypothetical protein D6805_09760 [Planctomycetota bacterium]|nr:MAG: hypothetical protein D6805_09760 [Planctomycetota bacterium]
MAFFGILLEGVGGEVFGWRNLFLKKVPKRKVFGKSENLFSKRFSEKKVLEKGFLGESFSPKSEKFWGGGGRGNTFFKKGSPYEKKRALFAKVRWVCVRRVKFVFLVFFYF